MVLTIHSCHHVFLASLCVTPKTLHTLHALVDTGSGYNVIREEALPPLGLGASPRKNVSPISEAQTGLHYLSGTVVQMRLRIGTTVFKISFLVVDSLSLARCSSTNTSTSSYVGNSP